MQVFISSDPKALAGIDPAYTVEAEYGAVVVEGSILTLAHHGERSDSPCPCLAENLLENNDGGTIGVSHIDLDTVGGIMAVMGRRPAGVEAASFWDLAAFVDVNGAHKLSESGASAQDIARLQAYWAFGQTVRVFPPRDGSVLDVSEAVEQHIEAVLAVLRDDAEMLEAGEAFKMAGEALNGESFLKMLPCGVILRQSSGFVNHLYVTPDGRIGRAVVTHNPSEKLPGGAITASLADPVEGIHIGNMLSEAFSPECGGHAGIGGTERGKQRPLEDARRFASLLADVLGE